MEEKKQFKSDEQRAEESTFQHLLTFMSGKTFSRHALYSSAEFVKELGYDENTNEDDAVRLGIANLSNAISSRVLQIRNALKTTRQIAIIKSGKSEEELMKLINEKKERENGKKWCKSGNSRYWQR